jgi:hypothetical protein
MDQHLEKWLNKAYFYALDQGEDESTLPNVEEQFSVVGEYLFDLQPGIGFIAVLQKLANYYPIDPQSENQVFEDLTEFLLVFTVSHECELRQEFVQLILSMDSEAQQVLMQIIQEHLSKQMQHDNEHEHDHADECTPIENVDGEDDVVHSEHGIDSSSGNIPSNPAYAGHSISSTYSSCLTCPENLLKIERLSQEISRLKDGHHKEMTKMKQLLASEQNKVIDVEVTVMEKDKVIFNLNHDLQLKEESLQEYERSLNLLQEYKQQIATLQDELDILRPKANKYDALETTVNKLREKLEELSEVKSQLKEESTSHAVTFHKLAELEIEVAELRKLQPQVENYRNEVAEYHIQLSEYKIKLSQKEEELLSLKTNQENLQIHQKDRLSEHIHLVEELRVTAEQLRERERSGGIGDGMCELNPVLMQELNKLRVENKELWQKLDKTSLDSLDRLSKELADQKQINQSLQSKWMQTKDQLSNALSEIDNLQRRLQSSILSYQVLTKEFEETRQMYHQDLQTHKQVTQRKLHHREQQRDAMVYMLQYGHNLVVSGYRNELNQTYDSLSTRTQELSDTRDGWQKCREDLHQTRNDVVELTNKRKQDEIDHREHTKKMKIENDDQLYQQNQQFAQERQQLHQQFQAKLNQEAQRIMNLTADLESEAQKRRKVERLKKMYEAENQRHKMQLQAFGLGAGGDGGNGNGNVVLANGGDYQIAVKELKTMQEQLDAANQEILNLKNQLTSSRSSGGICDHNDHTMTMHVNVSPAAANKTIAGRGLSRAVRLIGQPSGGNASNAANNTSNSQMMTFLEQAELNDKRLEQLSREKRELLAKSLEENKEKLELSQKIVVMDKENTQLKTELRKITLEKERIERKYLKVIEQTPGMPGKENLRAALL